MVDIFGKKKLEDRIAELEAALAKLEGEKEQLLRTLEKRDEKISRLSSANQQANLALKAAEQRAAAISLAPPPAQSQVTAEAREGQRPKGRILTPREIDGLLERLKACRSPRDDLLSAYCTGPTPEDGALPPAIWKASSAVMSKRGGIILHSPQLFTLLLIPPFPIQESLAREGSAFALEPLEEMMETAVLIISAHAGETFLGVAFSCESFEDEGFVQSSVMGKHSKGGWSQKRFERLREEEVKGHADLVAERLADLMDRYKTLLKYAVIFGDEGLIRQIVPAIDLPVVERKLSRQEGRKAKEILLEEVYGFSCYRIDV